MQQRAEQRAADPPTTPADIPTGTACNDALLDGFHLHLVNIPFRIIRIIIIFGNSDRCVIQHFQRAPRRLTQQNMKQYLRDNYVFAKFKVPITFS